MEVLKNYCDCCWYKFDCCCCCKCYFCKLFHSCCFFCCNKSYEFKKKELKITKIGLTSNYSYLLNQDTDNPYSKVNLEEELERFVYENGDKDSTKGLSLLAKLVSKN